MKNLFNNLSEEEKNSIREQHEGGKTIDTSRFKTLMESKSGNVKPLISEQDLMNSVGHALLGPISYLMDNDSWKKLISSASPIFNVLNTDTGKQLLKTFFDVTPPGVIKNMSIAAANGDANSFMQAFKEASKRAHTDFGELKNAAFKDMKSFGKLLKQHGINEQFDDVEDELEDDNHKGPKETNNEDVLTVDYILDEVKNALDDLGEYKDSMEDAARELAKDILSNIKDDLAYLSESYEEALQDILDGHEDSESEDEEDEDEEDED